MVEHNLKRDNNVHFTWEGIELWKFSQLSVDADKLSNCIYKTPRAMFVTRVAFHHVTIVNQSKRLTSCWSGLWLSSGGPAKDLIPINIDGKTRRWHLTDAWRHLPGRRINSLYWDIQGPSCNVLKQRSEYLFFFYSVDCFDQISIKEIFSYFLLLSGWR